MKNRDGFYQHTIKVLLALSAAFPVTDNVLIPPVQAPDFISVPRTTVAQGLSGRGNLKGPLLLSETGN